MSKKGEAERSAHQSKLAGSGYRIPSEFYVDAVPAQESAEKESGDGGKAAADLDDSSSDRGYKGALKSPEEHAAEVRRLAQGGAPANKSATPGTQNPDSNAPPASGTGEPEKKDDDEKDDEPTRRAAAKKTAR